MSRRRSHMRRPLLLAVLPLALVPMSTASSQSSAAGDSVVTTSALRVHGATSGASVGVIDSAEIAASGARTLSELLMARVPGLSVRRRGGLTAEGSAVTARGVVSPLGTDIMLVVDGILVDGAQDDVVPGTLATISRLDDLTPSDVQRIEVLRGPAASALYGAGAERGVIVVTTRRGSDGPLSVVATAAAGITQNSASYPANYQLTSGPAGQLCNPRVYNSPAGCTPTTLYSWNPLEEASPFTNGRTTSARVALSGTTLGARTLMAVTSERIGGVTADDWQSRLGVHASVERALPGRVTVSAQGSYLERNASVGEYNYSSNTTPPGAVLFRGLLGEAYDDSLHGYFPPDVGYGAPRLPEPSTVRTTSALTLRWRALPWLDVDATGGQDRVREAATRVDTVLNFSALSSSATERWTSGNLHLGMTARQGDPANLALVTSLSYDDVRLRDMRFSGTSWSWTTMDGSRHTQDVTIRQHFGWRELLDVNVGNRSDVGRGVAAPFGRKASRSADASLRLPRLRDGVDVRVRAAGGLSQSNAIGWGLRPRNGELEGGVDATFGQQGRLELTWYRAHARDVVKGNVPVYAATGYPYGTTGYGYGYGAAVTLPTSDVDTHGLEMLLSAQLLDLANVAWRATITATTSRSQVVATTPSGPPGTGFDAGFPTDSYWDTGYTWADANGDGFISRSEVQSDYRPRYVGGFEPTLEVGLNNSFTLPGRFTLGALLDYRGGQYRVNETERLRCSIAACLGVQDPTLSLADQARWMAITSRITPDVEPSSFLRIRELTLEWMAPDGAARFMGTERLAVRLVGQNLATWTTYSGIDPEVASPPMSYLLVPSDRFQWPLPRRMLVEVRVETR